MPYEGIDPKQLSQEEQKLQNDLELQKKWTLELEGEAEQLKQLEQVWQKNVRLKDQMAEYQELQTRRMDYERLKIQLEQADHAVNVTAIAPELSKRSGISAGTGTDDRAKSRSMSEAGAAGGLLSEEIPGIFRENCGRTASGTGSERTGTGRCRHI